MKYNYCQQLAHLYEQQYVIPGQIHVYQTRLPQCIDSHVSDVWVLVLDTRE